MEQCAAACLPALACRGPVCQMCMQMPSAAASAPSGGPALSVPQSRGCRTGRATPRPPTGPTWGGAPTPPTPAPASMQVGRRRLPPGAAEALLPGEDGEADPGSAGWLAPCASAGWAVTVEGPTGNHLPYFVATNESNTTVTGTLINVREAGSVDMPRCGWWGRGAGRRRPLPALTGRLQQPCSHRLVLLRPAPAPRSPTDPSATFWYRRPAYDQTGIFLEPKKVLWLTKTNTSGGGSQWCTPPAAGCPQPLRLQLQSADARLWHAAPCCHCRRVAAKGDDGCGVQGGRPDDQNGEEARRQGRRGW